MEELASSYGDGSMRIGGQLMPGGNIESGDSSVQTFNLDSGFREIDDSFENLQESEYLLSEFFYIFCPRIVHLNTLLQTLSVLGNAPDFPKPVSNS